MRGFSLLCLLLTALQLGACAAMPGDELVVAAGGDNRCYKRVYVPATYRVNPKAVMIKRPDRTFHVVENDGHEQWDLVQHIAVYRAKTKLVSHDYYSIQEVQCMGEMGYSALYQKKHQR